MNILLLNIDSKLPNLALKKIEMYHQLQGDTVTWNMPLIITTADKVYASCIFTKNSIRPEGDNSRKWYLSDYLKYRKDIICGGTGYDLKVKLPVEIESMNPKINFGFTTRGCIRDCKFCFVRKSEGYIRVVGDIYSIWDGKSKFITLMDNNILALVDHFELICKQLAKEKLKVDFNQGLDIRLVNDRICQLIKMVKFKSMIRFAFDSPSLEDTIREKVALLNKYDIAKHFFFYVLGGFDTTFEEDLHRLNVIKELKGRAYLMKHENMPNEERYELLSFWANTMWCFAKYNFDLDVIRNIRKGIKLGRGVENMNNKIL